MISRCFILTVVLLSFMTTVAQRRVTPVNTPATTTQSINENRLPGDSIDRSKLVRYRDEAGNEVLVDTITGREFVDSAALPKVPPMIFPLLKDVTVGVNLWDPLMRAFGQSYGLCGISAEVNLHNRYIPVIEAGLGNASNTPADNNYTFKVPVSPYFKVGINYNFLYNSDPGYQVYAGLRYGFSPFKWQLADVRATDSPGYWDTPTTINFPEQKATAGYLEVLFGLRVKLYRGLSAGWSVRFHKVLHQSPVEYGRTLYIPGYGSTGMALTGSFSVFYTVDLSHRQHRHGKGEVNEKAEITVIEVEK